MKELDADLNILICQKSKIDDWVAHFNIYYQGLKVIDCTKSVKGFNELFENSERFEEKLVLIINYDLIFRREMFLELDGFTLMLDESSIIQNDKSKRSKFIMKMKARNVILLSGTPTSGKYENLWTQIHLLGWDISKELYNKQYVNWKKIIVGGFPQSVVDKDEPYKNVERLKAKIRQHGAVFMKTEECFELPEQIFVTVKVRTSKEYRKFQKDCVVVRDFVGAGEVELIGDTALTKRLYLRQLCGHYSQEKLDAFADLVSSTQDRLVVFYNFTAELNALKKIARGLDRAVSEVSGQVKDLSSYEDEESSVTFVQYQAGAKGLNLQKANKIIFFVPTDKVEDFMQSQKRIHRIGQEKSCFYYKLVCSNSIEEDIYRALEKGVDYTDWLFEGEKR